MSYVQNTISLPAKSTALKKLLPNWITAFQMLLDGATVFGTFLASFFFYTSSWYGLGKGSPQTLPEFAIFATIVAIVFVFLLDKNHLYERETSLLNVSEIRGIINVGLIAAALVFSASFYLRDVQLSRIMITVSLIGSPIFLILQRLFTYQLLIQLHQRGISARKVLIYGAGNIGTQLARRMLSSPGMGLFPVGFLDDNSTEHEKTLSWKGSTTSLRVLGDQAVLKKMRMEGKVDLLLIAIPSAPYERNRELIEWCVQNQLDYMVVPTSYGRFIQDLDSFHLGGIPVLKPKNYDAGLPYLALKRILDLIFSILLLLIFLPIGIVISILIKMDTKGPILFKQKRVGLRGREFSFYKFRTMHADSEKYGITPNNPDDPRITKTGKWLRRSSLDELPQLFNVFRGDMSLVGPRPEMPFIVETYSAYERLRLEAKPGITGIWQISAVRGEAIHKNMEYDMFYLQNRSTLLDVAILIKTTFSVIRGIGAI